MRNILGSFICIYGDYMVDVGEKCECLYGNIEGCGDTPLDRMSYRPTAGLPFLWG